MTGARDYDAAAMGSSRRLLDSAPMRPLRVVAGGVALFGIALALLYYVKQNPVAF